MKYSQEQIERRFEAMTSRAIAECVLTTELVGGASSRPEDVEAFVTHHLKLTGDEAAAAAARILREEGVARDITPENGEVEERYTYGLGVIRRDEHGPWIGNWMIKAALKQAASRVGLFTRKRGSKGAFIELGRVSPVGHSSQGGHPERVHLFVANGGGFQPASTYFEKFKGRVASPRGAVSIVSDRECVAAGARFAFEFRWGKADGRVTEEEVLDVFTAYSVIGQGSGKAFERGKIAFASLDIELEEGA